MSASLVMARWPNVGPVGRWLRFCKAILTMLSVLEDLVAPLRSKDYHIIRYNSRGVGGSSGWPSFTGFKECEDLQSLVQWALANPEMPNINNVVIIVSKRKFLSISRKTEETCCTRVIRMDHSLLEHIPFFHCR